MIINLTYDASVDDPGNPAPAGYKAVFEAVAQFFESTYSDPITVNINPYVFSCGYCARFQEIVLVVQKG